MVLTPINHNFVMMENVFLYHSCNKLDILSNTFCTSETYATVLRKKMSDYKAVQTILNLLILNIK